MAKREKLGGKEPVAQALLERVEAFNGFNIPHQDLGILSFCKYETEKFIDNYPRSPKERHRFRPSGEDFSMYLPQDFFSDKLRDIWLPDGDGHVVCELFFRGNGYPERWGGDTKFTEMDREKEKIQSILQQMGIREKDRAVEIVLGDTHSGDKIVVDLTAQAYENLYVPAATGFQKLYTGYAAGKRAYKGPPDRTLPNRFPALYLAAGLAEEIEGDIAAGRDNLAARALKFVRQTGHVKEESLPELGAVRFAQILDYGPMVPLLIDNHYYDANELNRAVMFALSDINDHFNGAMRWQQEERDAHAGEREWFAEGGKTYVPWNKAFQQVAYHFEAKHGLTESDKIPAEIKQRTFGKYYMELDSDALPEKVKQQLHASLGKVKADLEAGTSSREAGNKFVRDIQREDMTATIAQFRQKARTHGPGG
jgi:hypothetical protein